MDYTSPTLRFNSQMNFAFNEILFEQMERESSLVIESMNAGYALLEAVDPNQNKQNFFAKLIEFIKRVFQSFTEKVRELFQNHKAWLDANYAKLEDIDYGGLEAEIVPFWNQPIAELRTKADTIAGQVRKVLNDPNSHERYKDFESLKTGVFKQYLDENGDLANGLKNYFRMGKPTGPLTPERLTNETLRKMVLTEFRVYCLNYDKEIVPIIRKQVSDSEKDLNMVNRILSRKPANEQFLLIENALYSESELAVYPKEPVYEADNEDPKENTNQTNTKNNQQKQQQPHRPSKVTVTDHGNAETANKSETMNEMSSSELTFMKNVAQARNLIITSLMTVCEERYNAYINVLRQVVRARAPKKEPKAKTSGSAVAADNVNVKAKK